MSATLSAPNPIKTIYKKLVFFDEDSTTAAFEFQYTNATSLEDIPIEICKNNFDFSNQIKFSATIVGPTDVTALPISLNQLHLDIYGQSGSSGSQSTAGEATAVPTWNNVGDTWNLTNASIIDVAIKEHDDRVEKDIYHDVELDQIEKLLVGTVAYAAQTWDYSDFISGDHPNEIAGNPWDGSGSTQAGYQGSGPYIGLGSSATNLAGADPDGVLPALATLEDEVRHNRTWLETLDNITRGTDGTSTPPGHPDPTSGIGNSSGDFIGAELELTGGYYYNTDGAGNPNIVRPGTAAATVNTATNMWDAFQKLDYEIHKNESWLSELHDDIYGRPLDDASANATTIGDARQDNPRQFEQTDGGYSHSGTKTRFKTFGAGEDIDSWARHENTNSGSYLKVAGTAGDSLEGDTGRVQSFSQALAELDYQIKNLWDRRDLDYDGLDGSGTKGLQTANTKRRSIKELNYNIDSLCVQIGTDDATTDDGVPIYNSAAGNIYATNNVIKTDIDSLDQRLEDTTQDLYNQTGTTSWNSAATNIAYNSSAMTDLQGLKYMLNTMQSNIGLTGADAVTDGVYTSDSGNVYGVGDVIKGDITALDAEVQAIKTILTGGTTAGDTYDTSGTTGDDVESNINNIQTEIDYIETSLGSASTGVYTRPSGVYLADNEIKSNILELNDQLEAVTTMITGATTAGAQYTTTTTGTDIEANVNAIQTELDGIESGAGLNTDGSYTSPTGIYLGNSTLKDDIDELDAQLEHLTTEVLGANTAATALSTDIGTGNVQSDIDWIWDTLWDSSGGGGSAGTYSVQDRLDQVIYGPSNAIKFQSEVDANSNKIVNLSSPHVGSDAANKAYVDQGIVGFNPAYNSKVATAQIADAASLMAHNSPSQTGADPVGGLMAIDTSHTLTNYNDDDPKAWANKENITLVDTSAGSVEYEHGGIAYDDTTKAPMTVTTNDVYIDGILVETGDLVLITGEALAEVDGATWRESTAPGEQGWHWRNGVWKFNEQGDNGGIWERPTTGVLWNVSGSKDIGLGTYHPVKEGYQNGLTVMQAIIAVEGGASDPNYPMQSCATEAQAGSVLGGDSCSAWSYFQGLSAPASGNVTHVQDGTEIHLDFDDEHFEVVSGSPDYLGLLLAPTTTVSTQTEIPFTVTGTGLSLSVDNNFFAWDGNKLALTSTTPFVGASLAIETDTLTAGLVSGKVGIGTTTPDTLLHIHAADNDSQLKFTNSTTGEGATDGTAIGLSQANSEFSFWNFDSAGFQWYTNNDGANKMALSSTGNLTLAGTVDGRDVDADGTKLDTIDTNANNYSHYTYTERTIDVDTGALTGANVVSDIDFDFTSGAYGHVNTASCTVNTRVLTLGDLGYTGSATANDYTHPSVTVTDQTSLTGATVISGVGTTGEGHVDALTTRTLTAANLGVVTTSTSVTDGITTFNKYSHPSHPGDDMSVDTGALGDAVYISDLDFNVTTDTLGHVTDANASATTKTMTLAHLGYTGSATANDYSHPVGAGNKHIPTAGAAGQFLKYSASGTAVWAADNNTTYTVGDGGLTKNNFTDADHTKLNGIAASANNYNHPAGDGNKHVPAAGASGEFLKWSEAGTAVWATPSYTTNTNTTYSDGTGIDQAGTVFSITAAQTAITSIYNTGLIIGRSSADSHIDFSTDNVITFKAGGESACKIKNDGEFEATSLDISGSANIDGNIYMTDENYIGISSAERIVFDSNGGSVEVHGADFGINCDPYYKFDCKETTASNTNYMARFWNDGGDNDSHGIILQCGHDAGSNTNGNDGPAMIRFNDGDGEAYGYLIGNDTDLIQHSTNYIHVSDERLKKDIEDTTLNGLDTINQLKCRDFTWKSSDKRAVCELVAQETAAVYSKAARVRKRDKNTNTGEPMFAEYIDDDKVWTVANDQLIMPLVKAMQELSAKNDALEARLAALESA